MTYPSGGYNNRVRFEYRPIGDDDGAGNVLKDWTERLTCWAAFRPQFGREQVASGQLQSTMLGVLTVRRSSASVQIAASDRVTFVAGPYTGAVCQIRSITPTMDNADFEMTLESGVAT